MRLHSATNLGELQSWLHKNEKITSEFENETFSLFIQYIFRFVNATILASDVFNMCGISGALHPNEARVYVPV